MRPHLGLVGAVGVVYVAEDVDRPTTCARGVLSFSARRHSGITDVFDRWIGVPVTIAEAGSTRASSCVAEHLDRDRSARVGGFDDLSAIKLETMNQYPTLTPQQVDKLVTSRYKLDEDIHSEDDVELSQIQLKIDADKARTGINDLREDYMLPVQRESSTETQPLFDEQWISNMKNEVNSIEALEFELGDTTFSFGLDDSYKTQLVEKNANLEQYFDSYVDKEGNWDIESLSMHRALVDNIDSIAKSLYQQGLSDGQRNIVTKAANVQAGTPGVGQQTQTDGVMEQIKQALGAGDTLMRFK